jgi:hypothetical protein
MINTPGQQLENSIRSDLPPHVELDPREEALLRAAAAQADDIAALEADIAARGCVLEGGAVNPAVREVRQARLALARLLSGIDLPEAANVTTLRAERAARARWSKAA